MVAWPSIVLFAVQTQNEDSPQLKGSSEAGQEDLVQTFQGWSCYLCGGAAEEQRVGWQDLDLGLFGGTKNGVLLQEVGLLLPRGVHSAAVCSFLPLSVPKADAKLLWGAVNEYNSIQGPK